MKKIRVLLAEDYTIIRKGLRALLEKETGMEIAGEAEDGREAINKAGALCPDVVVMDIAMPGMNGLEATRQMKKRYPGIKIIILTVHPDEEYIFQTLRAGASGYLVKSAAPTDLTDAIRAVMKGESFLSPSISRTVIDAYIQKSDNTNEKESAFEILTQREREIMQLIAEGLTTREIADKLCISIKTVETHRSHLKEKLNARNMAELIQYAVHKGLIVKNNSTPV